MSRNAIDVLVTIAINEVDSDGTDDVDLSSSRLGIVPELIVTDPDFATGSDTETQSSNDEEANAYADSILRDFYANSWKVKSKGSDTLLQKLEEQHNPKKRRTRKRRNSDSTDSVDLVSRRRRKLPPFPKDIDPDFVTTTTPMLAEPADYDDTVSSSNHSDYDAPIRGDVISAEQMETDESLEKIARTLQIGAPRNARIMSKRRRAEIVSGLQNVLRLHDEETVLQENVVKLIKKLLDSVRKHMAHALESDAALEKRKNKAGGRYKSGGPSGRVGSFLTEATPEPVEVNAPITPIRKQGWAVEAGATILGSEVKQEESAKKKKRSPIETPSKRTREPKLKKSHILDFQVPEGENPLEAARRVAREKQRPLQFIAGTQVSLPVLEKTTSPSSSSLTSPKSNISSEPTSDLLDPPSDAELPLPHVAAAIVEALAPLSSLQVQRPRGIWGQHHDSRTYEAVGGSGIAEGTLLCEEDMLGPNGVQTVRLIVSKHA
jgi:hypothetical protein